MKEEISRLIGCSKTGRHFGFFFELGAAVADNKRIIPVVIDDIGQENLPCIMV